MDADRSVYLLGVVAVGWAVTYTLRALPFILFSRKARTLPAWIEKLGSVISPVIIAALVIYSYSTLEWRTLSPYAAGALTMALQLWRGNPLLSIISGTALHMLLAGN